MNEHQMADKVMRWIDRDLASGEMRENILRQLRARYDLPQFHVGDKILISLPTYDIEIIDD